MIPADYINSDYFKAENDGTLTAKKAFTCRIYATSTYVQDYTYGYLVIKKNGITLYTLDGDNHTQYTEPVSFAVGDTLQLLAYNERNNYSTTQKVTLFDWWL